MKRMKIVAVCLACFALVGCSSQTNEQIGALDEQLAALEADNKALQEQVSTLEVQLETLTEENTVLQTELDTLTKQAYKVYARDADTWEIVEVDEVQVDKGAPLLEQLQALAASLSETVFGSYTIEVTEIEEVNGEQIAMVDLQDKKDAGDATWERTYFQGSAGAEGTITALEQTLLQKQSDQPWVDGMRVTYNGNDHEYDHIVLGYIMYRNE